VIYFYMLLFAAAADWINLTIGVLVGFGLGVLAGRHFKKGKPHG
jgi:hypothetical protein